MTHSPISPLCWLDIALKVGCDYGGEMSGKEALACTVAGKCKINITKCETLLRSSRQIYILENIFTYHKTQLHGKNTFTKDETNLHFRKQMNKTQNTFTSPETNLQ